MHLLISGDSCVLDGTDGIITGKEIANKFGGVKYEKFQLNLEKQLSWGNFRCTQFCPQSVHNSRAIHPSFISKVFTVTWTTLHN